MTPIASKLILVLPLLADAGHALITASFVGILTGLPFSLSLVAWTLAWAYAPDLDAVLHFVRYRVLAADKEHPEDHRDGLHFPLVWAVGFGAAFYAFGLNEWSLTAALAVTFHFVNDLFGTGWGVQLFAPFSARSYRIFSRKNVNADMTLSSPAVSYTPEEKMRVIQEHGDSQWIEHTYLHFSAITVIEYGVFIVGVLLLGVWFFPV